MKRLLTLLFACALAATSANAQEVFNMLYDSATRTVNNPTSNYTQVNLAQFKKTALSYMRRQMVARDSVINYSVLDQQAYHLNLFIASYLQEVIRYSDPSKQEVLKSVVKMFIQATLDSPMWNDPDTETTHSYVTEEDLTPFSLDTDWEKAYRLVQNVLDNVYRGRR